jgi:hypothetical protein
VELESEGIYVESESEGVLGGVGVGRNFRWSRGRKEFLGGVGVEVGVGVGKNIPTPTSISV